MCRLGCRRRAPCDGRRRQPRRGRRLELASRYVVESGRCRRHVWRQGGRRPLGEGRCSRPRRRKRCPVRRLKPCDGRSRPASRSSAVRGCEQAARPRRRPSGSDALGDAERVAGRRGGRRRRCAPRSRRGTSASATVRTRARTLDRSRSPAAAAVAASNVEDEHDGAARAERSRPAASSIPAPAPVAQWIERSPPERQVEGANPAGRAPLSHRHGPLRRLRRNRGLRAHRAPRPARDARAPRRRPDPVRLRRGDAAPAHPLRRPGGHRRRLRHPPARRPLARPAGDDQVLRAARPRPADDGLRPAGDPRGDGRAAVRARAGALRAEGRRARSLRGGRARRLHRHRDPGPPPHQPRLRLRARRARPAGALRRRAGHGARRRVRPRLRPAAARRDGRTG